MTGQELKQVWEFEDSLKPGDVVLAKWTNSYYSYKAKAEIAKVNTNSFRIRLLEEVKYECANHSLPVGQEFSIQRCTPGSSGFAKWSYNNRVEPVEGY